MTQAPVQAAAPQAAPDASGADGPRLVWRASPVELALRASVDQRAGDKPGAFCTEVGRRLLLAELEFGSWVLRRVETIAFQDERNVTRQMTVDLRVPDDAPVFVDEAGDEHWLVPLAVMRRRTMVSFHMYDEADKPITMPGLRLVQQLDQSLLLAAAAAVPRTDGVDLASDREVTTFVQDLVAGDAAEVRGSWERYDRTATANSPLGALRRSPQFHALARQLRGSFSLFVFLPVREGRHRLLRVSFVEPIRWSYQLPTLRESESKDGSWDYLPQLHEPWRLRGTRALAALGLTSTRVRIQVPSAERAASYHVEVVAPPGVRIGQATLIAGRPNAPEPPEGEKQPMTADHEESDTLTVGLHGVEVPYGSLCRAQLELRAQSAGWLAVMASAGLAITAVLASVAWHAGHQQNPGPEQDTNVVVLLLTTAAAAATLVAHRESGGVAARLLVGVRFVAAACMGLPVVAAGYITYTEQDSRAPAAPDTVLALSVLTVLAALASLYLVVVWWFSRRVERLGRPRSPWDMTPEHRRGRPRWGPGRRPAQEHEDRDVHEAMHRHRFDRPAIGIRSAEAWHEHYDVTDASHERAVTRLRGLGPPGGVVGAPPCADRGPCPSRHGVTCRVAPPQRSPRSCGTTPTPAA